MMVAVAVAAAAVVAVGVVFHPLATVGDEGARVTGSAVCAKERAREAVDKRGDERGWRMRRKRRWRWARRQEGSGF